ERMAAIEGKAKELGAKRYKVEALPASAMPAELQRAGFAVTGARSETLTIWAHTSQEQTNDIAAWGERALDFLAFLLPGQESYANEGFAHAKEWGWIGFLNGDEARDLFFAKNPSALGTDSLDTIRQFGSHSFQATGSRATVHWARPGHELDTMVAEVA